jgi:hypothetical protein
MEATRIGSKYEVDPRSKRPTILSSLLKGLKPLTPIFLFNLPSSKRLPLLQFFVERIPNCFSDSISIPTVS